MGVLVTGGCGASRPATLAEPHLVRPRPPSTSEASAGGGSAKANEADLVAGLPDIFRRDLPANEVGPVLLELRQLVEKSGGSPLVLLNAAGAAGS
jgi:hypothetical protein